MSSEAEAPIAAVPASLSRRSRLSSSSRQGRAGSRSPESRDIDQRRRSSPSATQFEVIGWAGTIQRTGRRHHGPDRSAWHQRQRPGPVDARSTNSRARRRASSKFVAGDHDQSVTGAPRAVDHAQAHRRTGSEQQSCTHRPGGTESVSESSSNSGASHAGGFHKQADHASCRPPVIFCVTNVTTTTVDSGLIELRSRRGDSDLDL